MFNTDNKFFHTCSIHIIRSKDVTISYIRYIKHFLLAVNGVKAKQGSLCTVPVCAND